MGKSGIIRRRKGRRATEKILWIECLGFSSLIVLSWLDELIGLPHLLFGSPQQPNWQESAIESIAIALVWLIVFGLTHKILRRFRYLEDWLTMCAWCRKLQQGNEWVSLEDYCTREMGVDISHGICPQCGRNVVGHEVADEIR